MNVKQFLKLLLLSAIWGASFIFMRVISPVLGPVLTASMRTLIAGLFLWGLFTFLGYEIHWKKHYKHYIFIGIVNSSIPFFMYSFAALYLPASLSSIINAMAPMFGAVLAALFLIEPLNLKKVVGLILGVIGVAVVSSLNVSGGGSFYILSIVACVIAALCYGISSIYIKLKASHIKPKAIACASQVIAGLALLPFTYFFPVRGTIDVKIALMTIVFAIVCSVLAYLLYYQLLSEVGPTKTLTVTYLIPVFSILWGVILLGETLNITTIFGGLIIIVGTYLVTATKGLK